MALVIAHGVHETGRREILSINVGEGETKVFRSEFPRGLVNAARPACSWPSLTRTRA
jgi:transposase-like protein